MGAFVCDHVYFIGPKNEMESFWEEYQKAQADACEKALELSRKNNKNFTPYIDKVKENVTIYHGSIGVQATKISVDDFMVVEVYTEGEHYGKGFVSEEEDRHETNPILTRLSSKLWKAGDIKRVDEAFWNVRYLDVSDPNEILFKNPSLWKILMTMKMGDLLHERSHLYLDDDGLEHIARGGTFCGKKSDKYDELLSYIKTFPDRSEMTLKQCLDSLKTELYYKIVEKLEQEYKAVDAIIESRPTPQRKMDCYAASSFILCDLENEADMYEDYMDEYENCKLLVTGGAEDFEKLQKTLKEDEAFNFIEKPEIEIIDDNLNFRFRYYLDKDDPFPRPFAEELSKRFPNLNIDIEISKEEETFSFDENENKKIILYENFIRKSHCKNGTVSHEVEEREGNNLMIKMAPSR